MEFKGTRGKWFLSNYDVFTRQEGETDTCLFLSLTTHRNEDIKYNSLLISKAPEMLDLLNRISGEILRNDFVLDEKWYDQIQKLINEATNI